MKSCAFASRSNSTTGRPRSSWSWGGSERRRSSSSSGRRVRWSGRRQSIRRSRPVARIVGARPGGFLDTSHAIDAFPGENRLEPRRGRSCPRSTRDVSVLAIRDNRKIFLYELFPVAWMRVLCGLRVLRRRSAGEISKNALQRTKWWVESSARLSNSKALFHLPYRCASLCGSTTPVTRCPLWHAS
jgi:hypothetical protein